MSKQCAHTAFFMGLQRKQGEKVQEGQQFDIRGTVEEFRHSINMYMFWKPGMEIYVSHVRRRQIPSYVFPDGYRRARSRISTQHQGDKGSSEDADVCKGGSAERDLKRKKSPVGEEEDVKQGVLEKRMSLSPQTRDSVSPEIVTDKPNNLSRENSEFNTTSQVGKSCDVESINFSANTGPTNQQLKLAEVNEQSKLENAEGGCASNFSVVGVLASRVGSCEGLRMESTVGSSEGNNGSVEGSIDGSTNPGSSRSDSCEADSNLSLEIGCAEFTGGLQEELEVLNLSSLLHFLFLCFLFYIFPFSFRSDYAVPGPLSGQLSVHLSDSFKLHSLIGDSCFFYFCCCLIY